MKRIGLAIIATCFITGMVAVSAWTQENDKGMWDGSHAMHIVSKLGLDDKQSAEVKTIFQKFHKNMIKKRADIEIGQVELMEILEKDIVDIKAAEAKIRQTASLKADAAMIYIQGIEDVKAKITPDQKKRLTEMLQMKGIEHGVNMGMNCPMMQGGRMEMGSDQTPHAAVPSGGPQFPDNSLRR